MNATTVRVYRRRAPAPMGAGYVVTVNRAEVFGPVANPSEASAYADTLTATARSPR